MPLQKNVQYAKNPVKDVLIGKINAKLVQRGFIWGSWGKNYVFQYVLQEPIFKLKIARQAAENVKLVVNYVKPLKYVNSANKKAISVKSKIFPQTKFIDNACLIAQQVHLSM